MPVAMPMHRLQQQIAACSSKKAKCQRNRRNLSGPDVFLGYEGAPASAVRKLASQASENIEHQKRLMAETCQLLKMSRKLIRRTNELVWAKHEEQQRDRRG
jgi:hypothetical protein